MQDSALGLNYAKLLLCLCKCMAVIPAPDVLCIQETLIKLNSAVSRHFLDT